MGFVEIVEKQSAIISTQAEIIDELFCILAQQLPPEELGTLSCLGKIETAARLERELESAGA